LRQQKLHRLCEKAFIACCVWGGGENERKQKEN
jgi:hypothetical protein